MIADAAFGLEVSLVKDVVPLLSQARILYAEDHATVRLAVRDALEAEGWRVEVCADGRAALAELEGAAHYDVLLFDNELPGVSGLELTACARSLAHRRETPVVIISASEYTHEARRAGADLFLRKPDDISHIHEAISHLLGARDAE
jgi:CheY-like chemotaxis protein